MRYRVLWARIRPVGLLGPPLPRAMQGIRHRDPTIRAGLRRTV